MELPTFKISQFFFLFISIFIIYAFILYNFTKFSVNAGSKKNSILIEESYLLITVISWKNWKNVLVSLIKERR